MKKFNKPKVVGFGNCTKPKANKLCCGLALYMNTVKMHIACFGSLPNSEIPNENFALENL